MMIIQGFQSQGIQIHMLTTNEGTVNSDFNTVQNLRMTRKQTDTSNDTSIKKKAKEFVFANTAAIGTGLATFGERLQKLNDITNKRNNQVTPDKPKGDLSYPVQQTTTTMIGMSRTCNRHVNDSND